MDAVSKSWPVSPLSAAAAPSGTIPWPCLLMVFAATCIWAGITWDISWHQTIGRDSFFTPAHMVIYVGGLVAGLGGGWLILKTTFYGTAEERAASVRIGGLRGPLGAWVTVWAALAMLISAPFDDWWHNAYGLDVQILSPPHALLALGMHHVEVGALLLVASVQNRSDGNGRRPGRYLFVYTAGVMLALATLLIYEFSLPNQQHSAVFYQASAALYPVLLVTVARASTLKWAATGMASVYLILKCLIVWLLPLFAAEPKLAPIYNPVDHFVPPAFPLLLIVPAIGIDLLFRFLGRGRSILHGALLLGLIPVVFLALFVPTQWHFSKFLLTPGADNWFFAGDRYWSYSTPEGEWQSRFWNLDSNPVTTAALRWALLWAFLSTFVGLCWGNWMAKVKR